MSAAQAIWHDLECGSYAADLPLWRELAQCCQGPILDIGAGTGRVTLELAALGHDVTALDRDPELLAALAARARGLEVRTAVADARDFELDRCFALILVPMQTIQLLGGDAERAGLLRAARAHLDPGGVLAIAIADVLASVSNGWSSLPSADACELGAEHWSSQVVAVYGDDGRVAIERRREITPGGASATSVEWLDVLTRTGLEREARAAGLQVAPARIVAASDEYVGSTVVMLGA